MPKDFLLQAQHAYVALADIHKGYMISSGGLGIVAAILNEQLILTNHALSSAKNLMG